MASGELAFRQALANALLTPEGGLGAALEPYGAKATTLHLASSYAPSYTDVGADIVGREYLGAWVKYWRTTEAANAKIIGSGDSTMEATSVGLARYTPAQLLPRIAYVRGFSTSFVNDGKTGQTSAQWLSTHLPALLTAHAASPPKLIILSWGRNDPSAGITNAQTMANMATGIAMIRAQWSPDTTSIILVQPNTAWESGYGRDETWNEAMGPRFRQGARDNGYCFIDLYKIFREARYNLTTGWLDATKLHANEDLYLSEYGLIADVLFPQWLADLRSGPFTVTLASGNPAALGLSSSWPAAVYLRGQEISLKGRCAMFNTGAIAAGTSFFTVPPIGRSSAGAYFKGRRLISNASPASRANVYDVLFYMSPGGLVVNVDAITEASSNGEMYFDGAMWIRNIYDPAGVVFASYQL